MLLRCSNHADPIELSIDAAAAPGFILSDLALDANLDASAPSAEAVLIEVALIQAAAGLWAMNLDGLDGTCPACIASRSAYIRVASDDDRYALTDAGRELLAPRRSEAAA